MNIKRRILDTTDPLVTDGIMRLGVFSKPFRSMNLLDALILGGRSMRWFRRLRLKEWVGFGIVHPDLYCSMIIQDAKYLASSAFYAYNRHTGEFIEHSAVIWDRSVKISSNPWNDHCRLNKRGYFMEFYNHLDAGRHHIRLDISGSSYKPAIRADLTLHQDISSIQPLVVSLPLEPNHYMYTHKAPLEVEGNLCIGDNQVKFDSSRDLANLDEQKAYYPYHARWQWATFTARDEQNRVIALNIANQMFKDQSNCNENAIWIDGQLSLLSSAQFDFDPSKPEKTWSIKEKSGNVELFFTPDGGKFEKRNLGIARIDYYQMFGCFQGFLVDNDGNKHLVRDYYGVAENMDTYF